MYMHCGCSPPGETFLQRLRRVFGDRHCHSPLLVPTDDGTARAATHPSDHNAVFFMYQQTQGMVARERRKKKAEVRRAKAEKAASRHPEASRPRLTQLTKSRRPLHDYDHTPAFLELIPLPLGARCVGACGGIVNGAVTSGSGGCEVKAGGCSDSLSVTCRGCGVVDVEVGAVGAEADAIEAFHMAIPMFITWLLYMHESFHELIITPALLHRFMMRHNGHFCGVFANPRTSSGRFSLSDTSDSRSPMDAAHAAMRLVARD